MNNSSNEWYNECQTARAQRDDLKKEVQELLELLKKANYYINLGFECEDCDVYGRSHNNATDCSLEIETLLTEHGITLS